MFRAAAQLQENRYLTVINVITSGLVFLVYLKYSLFYQSIALKVFILWLEFDYTSEFRLHY